MANSLSVIAVTDTSKRYIVYERKKKIQNDEESGVTRKGIGSF